MQLDCLAWDRCVPISDQGSGGIVAYSQGSSRSPQLRSESLKLVEAELTVSSIHSIPSNRAGLVLPRSSAPSLHLAARCWETGDAFTAHERETWNLETSFYRIRWDWTPDSMGPWLDLGNMSLMGRFPILASSFPQLGVGRYTARKAYDPHTAGFRHL